MCDKMNKNVFKSVINSRRKFQLIEEPCQLIDILKKRGVINSTEASRNLLQNLLEDEQYESYIINAIQRNANFNLGNGNIYALQRQQANDLILENRQANSKLHNGTLEIKYLNHNEMYKKNRNAIIMLISEDIGRKWRDFGRALKLKEGMLDEYSDKYGDIKTRTIKIIEKFETIEEASHESHTLMKLIGALKECKRNDLSRSIEKLFI